MKIFELGPGMKFRGVVDGGQLRLEFRSPWGWTPITAQDVLDRAMRALAMAALGSPPAGFRFTTDDRFSEADPRPSIFRRP